MGKKYLYVGVEYDYAPFSTGTHVVFCTSSFEEAKQRQPETILVYEDGGDLISCLAETVDDEWMEWPSP